MASRLINFFTSQNLFSETQHGFLKGRSTDTALFEFTNLIYEGLEDGGLTCGAMLDLSKAFDCLDHHILLNKLWNYGVRGNVHNWFVSYLKNRQQKVVIGCGDSGVESARSRVETGVPQGSLMGPILFVIYINSMPRECGLTKCINYADDISFLLSLSNAAMLEGTISEHLQRVHDCLATNRLMLNIEKTHLMLFKPPNSNLITPDKISYNNLLDIQFNANCKLLGIYLDQHLNYKEHTDKISLKLNKACYAIRVLSRHVSIEVVKTAYFGNVYPILKYGIIMWGSSNIHRVFVSQKKILRTMLKMKPQDSCRGHFKGNALLTLQAIHIYESLVYLFKNKHYFEKNKFSHTHNTRCGDKNLQVPIHRLSLTEKSPRYVMIKFFNALPNTLKRIHNVNLFKKKIFKILCDIEPYTSVEDFYKIKNVNV